MKRGAYREPDYAFGQTMLTIRSVTGFTQSTLAQHLGVSRQSVVDWEAGNKYPGAKNLQAFIKIAIEHRAFTSGSEAEEIRALWNASKQKILLDENWLWALLAPLSQINSNRYYWHNALTVDAFYGRKYELNLLTEWIVDQQCRMVTILGLGGMGKSSLAVYLMHQIAENFEIVIWRSLRDLPTCDALLADLLQVLVPQAFEKVSDDFEERMSLLMEQLRSNRVLLVLDNVESVLEENELSGRIRAGYEGFGRFLTLCAETYHRSSLLLTSRQKPDELLQYESTQTVVRSLRLVALDVPACEKLLTEIGVTGTPDEQHRLIQAYAGTPLALKVVAQTINDLFGGQIGSFLDQGGVVFGNIHQLLHGQYQRLSPTERRIVLWLAIMREPITFTQLQNLSITPLPPTTALETMNNLYRHGLIERGQSPGSFTLQSVVLEYLTEQFIAEASQEIWNSELDILIQHGLEHAHIKDYIRDTQTRFLVSPILLRLQSMALVDIEEKLCNLLHQLRERPPERQGYAPSNLIILLREWRGHLNGLNLSRLLIRGVSLQGVEMRDVQLQDATMHACTFTETYNGINTFALSKNGQYWAASSQLGDIRLWDAHNYTLQRFWSNATDFIFRIALSHDGRMLVGGTSNGVVKAWDTATGNLLWSTDWSTSVSIIMQITFSPDGFTLLVRADDHQIHLLDADTGQEFYALPHPVLISLSSWNRKGDMIATGTVKGVIRLWSLNLDDKTHPVRSFQEIQAYQTGVFGLSFSPDDRTLVSTSEDANAKFWDVASGQLIGTIEGYVARVIWSLDGHTLAISGRDKILWLWDVATRNYRTALQHTTRIRNAIFTPDAKNVITITEDGKLHLWDLKSGECLRVMQGFSDALQAVDWSPDDQQLVASGTDWTVTIFSIEDQTPPRLLKGHKSIPSSVAWSPDYKIIASADQKAIRLWDAHSGECQWTINSPYNGKYVSTFYEFAWRQDGKLLGITTDTLGILLWDMETHQFREFQGNFPVMVSTVCWRSDGQSIAAAGKDQNVYVWDAHGKLIRCLSAHQKPLESLDWNAEHDSLVSVSGDEIILWDVDNEEIQTLIDAQTCKLMSVVWVTRNTIITGGADGFLRWWDVFTGQRLFELATPQEPLQHLKTNSDSTKLASCGTDGSIMIWDTLTGEHLKTLRRDRPYERMDITGVRGLTEAQKATLLTLGAFERL